MASTVFVLVMLLGFAPMFLALLAAVSLLAKRNDQKVKSLSWSPTRGITAEFYESSERDHM
jgi:hypothetical protein